MLDIQRLIMKPTPKRFAIFVLGAGFSQPAGLPLANELWQEVRRRAEDVRGHASSLGRDLNDYIQFRRRCDGIHLETAEIDFEDFLGFLDTEFYLGLRGSDNWGEDGNETQLLVKRLIGQILMERTPSTASLGITYLQFAERLQPGDLVLTFNYDILLERALEAVGKPFRLFPQRFTAIHGSYAEVDSSRDEVIVLKLHGSANWFDRKQYRLRCEAMTRFGITDAPKDLIFNGPGVRLQPIVEGPRFPDDPLVEMYRLLNTDDVFGNPPIFGSTPWLLNPSSMKIVFAQTLKDFWWGLGRAGGMNRSMAIIGFSLPPQDDYARQAIYRLIRNYQGVHWDEEILGLRKTPLVLVDFRQTDAERNNFRQRYAFVDWGKAECCLEGFNEDALQMLFPQNA
jgi:SIR2-like domain